MEKTVSIVIVDRRPYRVIAQENWGLTKEQMKGKHVHHRIRRSDGGTNDPSNLFVCSPWYHDVVWHGGSGGFIGVAAEGGQRGGQSNAVNKTGFCGRSPEKMSADGRKGGNTNVVNQTGFLSDEWQGSIERHDHNVRNGIEARDNQTGIHSEEWKQSEKCAEVKKRTGSANGNALRRQQKGIFSTEWTESEEYTAHQSEAGKVGGKKASETNRENKTGVFGLTADQLSENARKANSQIWESTEDGFRGNAGNVARHNRVNGWNPLARVRVG
jgi:hypothetical protein